MDAAIIGAIAGVVGAAVGAAGAVTASAVTGRAQSRGQHAHWRRDVRRTAYAAYLNAARDAHEKIANLDTAMSVDVAQNVPAETSFLRFGELVPAAQAALEQVHRHQLIVELEGPPPVVAACLEVTLALHTWFAVGLDRWQPTIMDQVLSTIRRDRSLFTPPSSSDFPSDHLDQAHYVSKRIESFTLICRGVLDDETDQPSR